jgi:tryptophan synthase beta chain
MRHFDLASYDAYLSGRLQDFEHPGAAIAEAMEALP